MRSGLGVPFRGSLFSGQREWVAAGGPIFDSPDATSGQNFKLQAGVCYQIVYTCSMVFTNFLKQSWGRSPTIVGSHLDSLITHHSSYQ